MSTNEQQTPSPPGPEPAFSPHALKVLEARYLARDAGGEVCETPAGMLWRVARAVASVEPTWGGEAAPWARRFYEAMARLEFLPNSPTLMNAGSEGGQLSACFVIPVDDSLDAIFEAVKYAAQIHNTGGGTGFSFSRLRPSGDPLTERGTASGPVAFMQVFNAATGAVHQGGVRRGANMGILRVDHPDILRFIEAKRDATTLTHFNLSVAVTDAFMAALAAKTDYALINPRTGNESARCSATDVWTRLVDSAWASGDPGLVFIDRINATQPTPALGAIESTNPCGEVPLLPYESCNLGSIDVSKFVAKGDVEWERLRETIRLGVRFLDDVIEANAYPLPEIHASTRATRKVGLGVMGWADLLIALGIPYASQEALDLADRLGAFILDEARATSRELAEERGPFPAWGASRWARDGVPGPLRNATVTTIAPTGTIAILSGCSSGIEPLFALSYVRRALDGTAELPYEHPALRQAATERALWSDELGERVRRDGHLSEGDDSQLRALFATSHEIAPEWHVKTQAAFQRHVENAVSKTINLPPDATPADVDHAYRLAYELDCKGITVYRDGCRTEQILTIPGQRPSLCNGPECDAS